MTCELCLRESESMVHRWWCVSALTSPDVLMDLLMSCAPWSEPLSLNGRCSLLVLSPRGWMEVICKAQMWPVIHCLFCVLFGSENYVRLNNICHIFSSSGIHILITLPRLSIFYSLRSYMQFLLLLDIENSIIVLVITAFAVHSCF